MCRSSNLSAIKIGNHFRIMPASALLVILVVAIHLSKEGRQLKNYSKMASPSESLSNTSQITSVEDNDGILSPSFHEDICKLLMEHIKHGHWEHQFAFSNMTDLIQIDPRLRQNAVPITNESLNKLSDERIYLSQEMNWLHGKSLPPTFGNSQCIWTDDDDGRGISYLSTNGNQCGCGTAAFQPSHSIWVLNEENTSKATTSRANSQYNDIFGESPSIKLARRFARKNQTVCFAGDSIERQFHTALRNNLHRAELLHREHLNKSIVNVTTHQYPLHYVTNATSYGRTERYRMPDDFWMFGREVEETTVTFMDSPREGFRFKYFKQYMWAPWMYEHMESCDVIIMNQALHYHWINGRKELYDDTTAAISYLINFTASSENRVAIWRSALPQHFDIPEGHYPLDKIVQDKKCVAIKEEYILQENNSKQEYNKVHDQVFSELCSTENSSCGDAKLRCTVKTNDQDIFSVYSYWIANNLTAELKHAQKVNPTYPNVTGTILRWELFDLFDVPMWHAQGKLLLMNS